MLLLTRRLTFEHRRDDPPEAPRHPFVAAGRLIEVPMTTVRLFGRNLPASGGGFFRLLPYHASRWALHRVNRTERMAAVSAQGRFDPGHYR